jgi:hypothetical protein
MDVPHWRCRELLGNETDMQEIEQMKLWITAQGALRIT